MKSILRFKYHQFKASLVGDFVRLFKIKARNFSSRKDYFPRVVNLNANDVCNSKCVMCNIWQQKKAFEFKPEQIETILKNDFFRKVEYVGVTGGEPTLRNDLPEIYESIIKSTSGHLKGVSIITNCINNQQVKTQLQAVKTICDKHGIYFSIMVSLDGLEKEHDSNRGTDKNFASTIDVINFIKKDLQMIPTIGCTITKKNCHRMEEFLDFVIALGVPARFRVAEYIERLYNGNIKDVIRSFTDDERYYLTLFYHRLINFYEKDELYQRTYLSIISILNGGKRLIGCPYQQQGVVLNSKAEMSYCAPKSPIIANLLSDQPEVAYLSNLDQKNKIIEKNCSDCIHDYHSPITASESISAIKTRFYRRMFRSKLAEMIPILRKVTTQEKSIFITGWYGTETVGDKAILGGIIQYYRNLDKDSTFIVSSLFPEITVQTMKELRFEGVSIVSVYSHEFFDGISEAKEVVMGGGPLMEIEELNLPLTAFRVAKKLNKKTIVFGCGLGPLYSREAFHKIQEILRLSDKVWLRDKKSMDLAEKLYSRPDYKTIEDPAIPYVQTITKTMAPVKESKLSAFLRDITREYFASFTEEDFQVAQQKFLENISQLLLEEARLTGVSIIELHPMHSFVIGGDDRIFNRNLERLLKGQGFEIRVISKPASVEDICEAMKSSSINICMRYHSVVFAETLGTNFKAIDYTGGGKILSFLKERNRTGQLININSLIHS